MPKCMPERDRTCFWLAGRLAGGWLHANLRTENSESQSVDLLLIEKRACMGSLLSSLDFVPGPDLGMRCCLAGWRSQWLSCEQLIGADETNPSRGPRPPESKKNGRAVLYCTYLRQKWVHGLYMNSRAL
jgi:hypothetical protein